MKVRQKSNGKKKLTSVPDYADLMSVEDRNEMQRLSRELTTIDDEAVHYIENGQMPPEKSNFDQMNKFIHMQMFSMCLSPLQNGFSASNLVQGVLMYKTMALLNKDFKDNVHATVSRSFLPLAEKMANQPGASEAVIKKRDAILREANNGRLPLDEHSAALVRVGICRNAYNMSREPGANLDDVMEKYNQAMGNLEKCMQQDGVDPDATDVEMRTIVGRYAREDPKVLDMFAETSYGDIRLSDFHEEKIHVLDADGHPIEKIERVWRGEFENASGEDFQGGFTPRFPQSKDEYQKFISDTMKEKMGGCINGTELFETIGSGPTMYDPSGRLSYWMQQDGFSKEEVMQMQKSSFEESLSSIRDNHPNLFADFSRVYQDIRQQQYQRSQRGHEFDDMFENQADSSAQYY